MKSTKKRKATNKGTAYNEMRMLVTATVLMLTTYIYLTVKLFSELPPIPSLLQLDILEQAKTQQAEAQIVAQKDNSKVNHHYHELNDQEFLQELAKQSPFPQSIATTSDTAIDSPSSSSSSSQFEFIIHPALELLPSLSSELESNMTVPKFYNPPIFEKYGHTGGIRSYLGNFGQRLMTTQEAHSIGSRIQLHNADNDKNGYSNDNDIMLETIFVAIASYRDYQCQQTVESILLRAKYPQRIRIAVVDQLDKTAGDKPCSQPKLPCSQNPNQILCKYKRQLDFYEMDATYAVGPVFARHLGHRMYRGEYFAMQCDAHVDFVKHWDTRIIDEWKSANNEMAVLTTYLSDVNGAMDQDGNLITMSRPIMCKSDFEGHGATKHLRHGQQPEGITRITNEPTLEPFWAAGFSFSRGHFVINVPYDQHLPWVFQGEEISIGLRGFTYGYDYYAPKHSVCFHYYANNDKTGKRHKVNLFWEHSSLFTQKGGVVEKKGMMRLNGILNMNPEHIHEDEWLHVDEQFYGLGKVRTTQKFFDTFGIDVKEQKVQQHLCKFVGLNMQRKWKPHLRQDQMGINYDEIDYQFKDPDIYGSTW